MSSIAFAAGRAARFRQPIDLGNAVPTGEAITTAGNAILSQLGHEAAAELKQHSRHFRLQGRTVLQPPQVRADVVLFPESGLIAVQALAVDGSLSEVGAVGAEGAVGLLETLSGADNRFSYFTLAPTIAWVMPGEVVQRVFRTDAEAATVLWRYMAQAHTCAREDIACATRHRGLERLADRLLAYSRNLGARLPVTQDDLAQALGMTRTSVTALVTTLSNAGLTRTGRGWIQILAPDRLADLACGCRRSRGTIA